MARPDADHARAWREELEMRVLAIELRVKRIEAQKELRLSTAAIEPAAEMTDDRRE